MFCSQAGGDAKTDRFLVGAMSDQGRWDDYQDTERRVVGSTIHVGPVFHGEVFLTWCAEMNASTWRCVLNGEALSSYPTIERAKARIDWEVWNRVRQMAPAYKCLLERRAVWDSGGS